MLFAEASRSSRSIQTWRFVLQNVETHRRFCATDTEPTECSERLELLAVVRGLEALDGPARVTLVTKSRYVSRGLKSGLEEWRANRWCWERFGRMVPVRDRDLWQRVDRALQYHLVDCQTWHFDDKVLGDVVDEASSTLQRKDPPTRRLTPKYRLKQANGSSRRIRTDRQQVRSQPAALTIDTVWKNTKSWAYALTRPALRSTA